jgi:hypothetical protein
MISINSIPSPPTNLSLISGSAIAEQIESKQLLKTSTSSASFGSFFLYAETTRKSTSIPSHPSSNIRFSREKPSRIDRISLAYTRLDKFESAVFILIRPRRNGRICGATVSAISGSTVTILSTSPRLLNTPCRSSPLVSSSSRPIFCTIKSIALFACEMVKRIANQMLDHGFETVLCGDRIDLDCFRICQGAQELECGICYIGVVVR